MCHVDSNVRKNLCEISECVTKYGRDVLRRKLVLANRRSSWQTRSKEGG